MKGRLSLRIASKQDTYLHPPPLTRDITHNQKYSFFMYKTLSLMVIMKAYLHKVFNQYVEK